MEVSNFSSCGSMYKFDSSELSLGLVALLSSSANEGGTREYRGGIGQEQRV